MTLVSTTLVDATFKPNLSMVAKSKMVGKLEKSNGLNAFIATIRISKESKILLVKNISSQKDGKGRTIIATSINIPRGSPIFFITGLI